MRTSCRRFYLDHEGALPSLETFPGRGAGAGRLGTHELHHGGLAVNDRWTRESLLKDLLTLSINSSVLALSDVLLTSSMEDES